MGMNATPTQLASLPKTNFQSFESALDTILNKKHYKQYWRNRRGDPEHLRAQFLEFIQTFRTASNTTRASLEARGGPGNYSFRKDSAPLRDIRWTRDQQLDDISFFEEVMRQAGDDTEVLQENKLWTLNTDGAADNFLFHLDNGYLRLPLSLTDVLMIA